MNNIKTAIVLKSFHSEEALAIMNEYKIPYELKETHKDYVVFVIDDSDEDRVDYLYEGVPIYWRGPLDEYEDVQ